MIGTLPNMQDRMSRLDSFTIRTMLHRTKMSNAEESLYDFVKQAWHVVEPESQFADNWHIRALCDHLQEVSHGKRIKKLLINIPPGTMKSLLVSVFWPAWVWITKPEKRFFYASYGEDLVIRDATKSKDLIMSEWYQERWGSRFGITKNTERRYENTKNGWRMGATVGGKATGHHPDFKVVDDPHNAKQAESDVDRRNVSVWWDGTMASRGVTRGARSVIVMQRLHTKDLSGHVLEKGGYVHICLPMAFEAASEITDAFGNKVATARMPATPLGFTDPRTTDGDLLWPKLFTADMVKTLEEELGIYHAAGQLQQRPAPREGGMFKRSWFKTIINAIPSEIIKWIRYWDKAGKAGGEGARTAGALVGVTRTKQVVIADIVSGRWGTVDREVVIKQTAETDRIRFGRVETWVEQEPGSGGLESAEATIRNLAGYIVRADVVRGDKVFRAEPIASQAYIGNVVLLAGGYIQELLDELEVFPAGRCKDKVDALSGAYNKLQVSKIKAVDPHGKPVPKPDEKSPVDDTAELGASDFG